MLVRNKGPIKTEPYQRLDVSDHTLNIIASSKSLFNMINFYENTT